MRQMAEIRTKKLDRECWERSEGAVVMFFGGLKQLVEGKLAETGCRMPQDT